MRSHTDQSDNILVPLPGLTLPRDFAWQVNFVGAVDEQLRRLGATGGFRAPRFFGYYFRGSRPIGVSGRWTVALESAAAIGQLTDSLERMTHGHFSIASVSRETEPDFLLVHDRHEGSCWLWRFAYGLHFVESTEPTEEGDEDLDEPGDRKLLGP